MNVLARDLGTPQLQSQQAATVTITVLRNNNGPVFQETPYTRGISQNTISGTSVYRVTATDADVVRFKIFFSHKLFQSNNFFACHFCKEDTFQYKSLL